jgi:hypothetical protein
MVNVNYDEQFQRPSTHGPRSTTATTGPTPSATRRAGNLPTWRWRWSSLDELRAFARDTGIPLNVLVAYSDAAEAWPPEARRPDSASFTAHVRLASKDDRVQRLDALIAEHRLVDGTAIPTDREDPLRAMTCAERSGSNVAGEARLSLDIP